jgi:cell division protein FtsB
MKKLKNIFLQIGRIKALKYVLVSVIAIVLIGFVDENSVWRHIKNKQTISDLQEEVQKYSELNRRNQEQIRLLDSNPKAIEKIARERYFMKADDEDIFVLSSDLEETTPHETAE